MSLLDFIVCNSICPNITHWTRWKAGVWRFARHLHDVRGEAVVEPHPVARRHHADARHAAEDGDAYPPPVVVEVIGVDLGAEDGQDERQDGQQVDLAPQLQETAVSRHLDKRATKNVAVEPRRSQRCSRRRRRCQERSSPGCPLRCRRSRAPASGGSSSPSGGRRRGGSPPSTACTPAGGGGERKEPFQY